MASEEFDAEHDGRIEHYLQYLTRLRCAAIVAFSLAAKYPTAASWEEAMNSQVLLDALSSFSNVLADVEQDSKSQEFLDPEKTLDFSEQQYDRALDSLTELCEMLDIEPEDLLSVLND